MKYYIFFFSMLFTLFSQGQENYKISSNNLPYLNINKLSENIKSIPENWKNLDTLSVTKKGEILYYLDKNNNEIGNFYNETLELYLKDSDTIKVNKDSCFVGDMPCVLIGNIIKYDFALNFVALAYYKSERPYLQYKVSSKSGLIDYDGNIITDTSSVMIEGFRNGLSVFRKDNKWGFLNEDLEVAIPNTFTRVINFNKNGLARAENEKYIGFINKKGNFVYKYDKDKISNFWPFYDGYAFFKTETNKLGAINIKGEIEIDTVYNKILAFKDKITIAKKDTVWGFLKKSKWIPKIQYQELKFGLGDHNVAKKGGKWGVIDKRDNVIIPFVYEEILTSKNHYFYKTKNGWNAVNSNYNKVFNNYYDKIQSYNRGLFAVCKNKKCGFVNENNEIIIPLIFDYVYQFTPYGRSLVRVRYKYELIDEKGNFLSTKGWLKHIKKSETPN